MLQRGLTGCGILGLYSAYAGYRYIENHTTGISPERK